MHATPHAAARFLAGLSLTIALLGCSTGTFAQEIVRPVQKEKTAWEMVKDVALAPPYVFFVLVGCSLFTFTLIPERFMFYRKAAGSTAEMVTKIKQAVTIPEAITAIEHAPGISGRILRTALQASHDGYTPDQVEQLVQGNVTMELIDMEKFLPQLDSMVTLCPLIGLLGTTIGMIRSFSIVAAIGMSDPTKLAGGISEALINTATGLAIAIPALFAFNYFTGKKEAILMDLEKGLSEVMVILKTSHGRK